MQSRSHKSKGHFRGVASNLEVVRLASEGVWQLHWCTCVDYIMNIYIGNGCHGNYSYNCTTEAELDSSIYPVK